MSLDYIIDTLSTDHPLQPFISLLKVQRKLVLVGLPENHVYVHPVTVRADVYRSKICRGQFDWRSEGNSRDVGLLCRA